MRDLATIRVISELRPIPGADAIECARIMGWDVVVKKGEFKVGDKVCYCEIDSILPDKPEFEFLKNSKGVIQRIRTVKLRGQVSYGIAFPLSVLPEGDYHECQDVTDILGVKKWEVEEGATLRGKQKTSVKIQFPNWMPQWMRKYAVKYFLSLSRLLFNKKMGATFPPFIPKTDETRVQVLQRMLEKYEGTECYISEKLDGSSITAYVYNGEFGVCSRNIDLTEEKGNAFWDTVREKDIEKQLRNAMGVKGLNNVAIQGELIGTGIQGNKYKLDGKDIYFFNVLNIDTGEYLNFQEFRSFITLYMNEKTVPILETNHILKADSDYYVELAKGKSTLQNVLREGIVIRPRTDLRDYDTKGLMAGRVSFKAINPEFLLKFSDN